MMDSEQCGMKLHHTAKTRQITSEKKIVVGENHDGDDLRLLPSGSDAVKFGMYQAVSHSVTERLSLYLRYCFS